MMSGWDAVVEARRQIESLKNELFGSAAAEDDWAMLEAVPVSPTAGDWVLPPPASAAPARSAQQSDWVDVRAHDAELQMAQVLSGGGARFSAAVPIAAR